VPAGARLLEGALAPADGVGLPSHQGVRALPGAGALAGAGAPVVVRDSQPVAVVAVGLAGGEDVGERAGRGAALVVYHHLQLVAAAPQLLESEGVVGREGVAPAGDELAVEID
jgi:hypothetical protein